MEALRLRTLEHFETELTVNNVLTELFDKFASKYVPSVREVLLRQLIPSMRCRRFDEVMEVVLKVAIDHWGELKDSSELENKLADVTDGKLPHARNVLSKLLKGVPNARENELIRRPPLLFKRVDSGRE